MLYFTEPLKSASLGREIACTHQAVCENLELISNLEVLLFKGT